LIALLLVALVAGSYILFAHVGLLNNSAGSYEKSIDRKTNNAEEEMPS
jgi:hypothetical protein